MKTKHIFSLAALALTMVACSSDDTTQSQPSLSGQKIPFSAVINTDAAGTRALTEAEDGKSITAEWKADEQVALIHGKTVEVLGVESVDATNGSATIKGYLTTAPTDGEAVHVVYVGETNSVMADLKEKLEALGTDITKDNITAQASASIGSAQDGTLETISHKLDYRYAEAKFAVSEGVATFASSPKLVSQFSIWKLKLSDGTNDLKASKLVMKKGTTAHVTIDLGTSSTKSEFYMAFIPEGNSYTFEATVGESTYTCTPTISTAPASGKFYSSTLKMEAPVTGNIVDLSQLAEAYTAGDNDILKGSTSYAVIIPAGYTVTLNGASINYSGYDAPAITCSGSATIIIADGSTNSVTVPGDTEGGPSGSQYPGILAGGTGTTLTFKGGTSGTGKLTVVGGYIAAGIGCWNTNGGAGYTCGKIQIDGGIIDAYSGNKAALGDGAEAGIGCVMGGPSGDGCEGITINGGKVTAKGGVGLGQSFGTTCNFVTIKGGEVNATGTTGYGIAAKTVTISGGSIIANSNGDDGVGITGSNISISGSSTVVSASGAMEGILADGGTLTIEGGDITAAAGTTSGNQGGNGIEGIIVISGGDVKATGGNAKADSNANGGSGISGALTVNGGKVTATGGAGDGTGSDGFGLSGNVTLGSGISLFAGNSPSPTESVETGPKSDVLPPEVRYLIIKPAE